MNFNDKALRAITLAVVRDGAPIAAAKTSAPTSSGRPKIIGAVTLKHGMQHHAPGMF